MMWYIKEMGCVKIIFGHMYSWKILKLSHFMLSQGGGTPYFVILQG